jgi:phage tail sheath gpL-like
VEFAAEHAAIMAFYGAIDPARPFQTLPYKHAVAPADVDLFTNDERNLLLFDGIGTSKVVAGKVQVERPVTTYQLNAAGGADVAYLDSTTMLTLMYLRFSFRNRMQTKYPRHKLAGDTERISAGQKVMTPRLGKVEAVGWFRDMQGLGLVENYEQFKKDLVVVRNDVDRNRLDFLLPPDLMNQLIVTAAQIAFRL